MDYTCFKGEWDAWVPRLQVTATRKNPLRHAPSFFSWASMMKVCDRDTWTRRSLTPEMLCCTEAGCSSPQAIPSPSTISWKKKGAVMWIFLSNEGATRGVDVQFFPFSHSQSLMERKKRIFVCKKGKRMGIRGQKKNEKGRVFCLPKKGF